MYATKQQLLQLSHIIFKYFGISVRMVELSNGTEQIPVIDKHIYGHLIYDKDGRAEQWSQ